LKKNKKANNKKKKKNMAKDEANPDKTGHGGNRSTTAVYYF
jgi:hypothetical protein